MAPDSTVLVVDDHALFSDAVALALATGGRTVHRVRLETAGRSPSRLLASALRIQPDIALLDLDLGRYGDGRDLIRPLSRSGVDVVVVTGHIDEADWGGCLRNGARAVVPKHRPLAELISVVHRLEAGEPVLDPGEYHRLTSLWQARLAEDDDHRRRLARLTPREREVLGELMAGRTIREIADSDVVSEATVRTQVRTILHKLGVSTQIAAVGMAHRVSWNAPEPDRPVRT
ncbi:response regulator transcription factor [Nocardioides sp.]|uniref:response regulator transcription factor n=1 Tax=Nocardioides sp. TaxID=35761 RepID=UPI002ED49FE5